MPEPIHESYCCRSPESECARSGGCSSSCNCGAGATGEQCRPVTLPSGEVIPVLGRGELSSAGVAAVAELVEVARRKYAAEHVDDPGAPELWARIDAVLDTGLSLREVARECGLPFSVLFRIGQGRIPAAPGLAAIETWLGRQEATDGRA